MSEPKKCFALLDVAAPGSTPTAGKVIGLFWQEAHAWQAAREQPGQTGTEDFRVVGLPAPAWLPEWLVELGGG